MKDIFRSTRLGRVHCRVAGAGRTLFLMHSNGRSAHEFDAVAEALADRFQTVSWDMPGHGDSDRLRHHASVADLAGVAVDLAASIADDPPIIAGSSIGATIALAAGFLHQDAIAGVIPIELPIARDGKWWRDNWSHVEGMFACPDEAHELVRRRYRDVSAELASRLRVDRHKAGGAAMMQVLWAGRDVADATVERIAALRVPALFLNGDGGLAPEAGERLPRINPHVRLAIVEGSGHFPQTDNPVAVALAISDAFPAQHEASRDMPAIAGAK